jgi:hypothetical protein
MQPAFAPTGVWESDGNEEVREAQGRGDGYTRGH